MPRFDRAHAISYYRSMVTMALSCIISHINQISVENREICIPNLYIQRSRRNFAKMFSIC